MSRLLAALVIACAGRTYAAETGYVVKFESGTIYLDLAADSGAAPGRRFLVYTEGEELKHPVTGKSLGKVEQRVAEGEVREVAPQYSIGALLSGVAAAGQRVRWSDAAKAPPAAPAPAAPGASGQANGPHRPVWRSPSAKLEAVDLDVADLLGDGKREIVLADANRVQAFGEEAAAGRAWEPMCSFESHETGLRFLSLEAADLNGDGRAEVFATYHNDFFDRVETVVLECRQGRFEKTATLPWMVRGAYDGLGHRALVAQPLMPDKSFPFGGIFPLKFEGGKYELGSPAIRAKRLEWIYSFARTGATEGAPEAVFYDTSDRLRVQFDRGSWQSPENLGQSSNRVRWHERALRFSPRLPTVASTGGFQGLYAVRNYPRLGALADAFGFYSRGEVQKLRWTGSALETEWTADADGYVSGVATFDAPGAPVYAAVVNASGTTTVWKFTP